MSQTLRDARKYEETMEERITPEMRPDFHLSSRVGWMNDPNGFSYYNGEYHLFYQYHPYDAHWGPMHWGHAVSKDLLHWEYRPVAIAPDSSSDIDGCFSGSALTLPDGRQLLMYTGVVRQMLADGTECDMQRQCIAIGNGLDYEKYKGNPVLDEHTLPEGSSLHDFRDPKMWQHSDGSYRCVVGNNTIDRDGRILLYRSDDGFRWEFEKILMSNGKRFGRMWECPDFFELDGKGVLLVSPQDMLPVDLEYHNGNGTVCLVGSYDADTDTFADERNQAIDYGIDFYAPQTVVTPDGRRVMIGWMQNWDTSNQHMKTRPWFGQMSLPRELSLREDGRLMQKPVREIEALRSNKVSYEAVTFEDVIRLEGINGRCIDMEIELSPAEEAELFHKFAVRFAQDDQFHTAVSFRPYESILKIDRKFSGSRRAVIHQRRSRVNSADGKLKLRLILDRFSAEIFVNDGEQALTATIYTEQSAEGISFFADGLVTMNVVKYELKMR